MNAGEHSLKLQLPHVLLFLLLAMPSTADISQHTVIVKDISPGIVFQQFKTNNGSSPLLYDVLHINLHTPGIGVICGQSRGKIEDSSPDTGRETVRAIARRYNAIAGVNANFFPFTGQPLSLTIHNGVLVTSPTPLRPSLGIGPEGAVMDSIVMHASAAVTGVNTIPISGLNYAPDANEIVLLTPDFDESPVRNYPLTVVTINSVNLPLRPSKKMHGIVASIQILKPGTSMPLCQSGEMMLVGSGNASNVLSSLAVGNTITLECDLYAQNHQINSEPIWKHMKEAVSAGPWLLTNGQIVNNMEDEGFSKRWFVDFHHPRTAIGITGNGNLIMIVVDGRSALSGGISLSDLAKIMQQMGVVDAMNLDGGGSSTMVVQNEIVNLPSDGYSRPVSNALLVTAPPQKSSSGSLEINAPLATLTAGDSEQLSVTGSSISKRGILWGSKYGNGYVDQRGYLTCYQAGKVIILARCKGQTASTTVNVTAGPPANLSVALTPPLVSNSNIRATLKDAFGNPIKGESISFSVVGGSVYPSTVTTDINGNARTEVTWNNPLVSNASVTVTVNNTASVTVSPSVLKGTWTKP